MGTSHETSGPSTATRAERSSSPGVRQRGIEGPHASFPGLQLDLPPLPGEAAPLAPAAPSYGIDRSRVPRLLPAQQHAWATSVQRAYGNRAAARAIRAEAPTLRDLQPKLLVGPAGDAFEQEADRVAEAVTRGLDAPSMTPRGAMVQRRCAACGAATGDTEQPTCSRCAVQRHGDGPVAAEAGLGARIDARRGGGAPLPAATRAQIEPRLGHDLGPVRVHADGEAAQLSRALGAAAFTIGRDIFFGAGRFQPETPAGRRLLAHELAHTVQQAAVPALPGGTLRMQRLPAPAIQRMDDATFERSSGVDVALAATPATMTPVAGVHGTTFTASGCPDVTGARPAAPPGATPPAASATPAAPPAAPCNVAFRFEKAYQGDYLYRAAGRVVRGVYVKIVTTPTAACGACAPLRSLQVLRNFTQGTNGAAVTADPVDPVRQARSGWSNPAAPSRGWRIDRITTSTVPFFSNSNPGDATHPAILWDSPGDWATDRNSGKDFRTCALCTVGGRNASLACIDWGYYIDGSGTVTFRPAAPTGSCGTPTQLRDAATRWDAIQGNTPINLAP